MLAFILNPKVEWLNEKFIKNAGIKVIIFHLLLPFISSRRAKILDKLQNFLVVIVVPEYLSFPFTIQMSFDWPEIWYSTMFRRYLRIGGILWADSARKIPNFNFKIRPKVIKDGTFISLLISQGHYFYFIPHYFRSP